MKTWLLREGVVLLAILLAGILPGVARAQDNPDPAGAEPESVTDDPADPAVRESGAIVVTARRRDEYLQDVPIAVSAVTAAQAQEIGIDDTQALIIATPSLDFSKSASFAAVPFLRGVGTSFAGAGVESPVAIYVDDVYISSPNGNLFSLNNIESVQVLKGPQGTLFGRNATGGVIQIKTKDPSFTPEGRISVGYGNYETYQGSLYASTGLSDNVAVSIAASGRKQADGFGRSLTTDADTQKDWDWNVRAKLLVNLGDRTRVLISGDYSEQESDLGANQAVYPGSIGAGGTEFAGAYNTYAEGTDFTKIEQGGASLQIEHEASFADIVSTSAYRKTRMHTVIDQDAGVVPLMELEFTSPVETFSQELRLVSNSSGPFQWVVGAYYFHSNSQYDPASLTGLVLDPALTDPTMNLRFEDTQKLDSYSGFAEGTYEFGQGTSLTLGLRYTSDSFELENEGFYMSADTVPAFLVPDTQYVVDDTFNKMTYRAILDHKFTEDILGYASYSRGFKSGGYNLPEPGDINAVAAVRPEVLDAYEAGLKTQFFDGDLTFNIAAFYYDYQDLAVSITRNASIIQVNAAEAEIKGLDVDFAATPFDGFRISGGLGVLDGEYKRFPGGPVYEPILTPPYGNNPVPGDLAGNTIQRAPKLTFNLAPSYTLRAGNGDLTFAANWYHNSGYFADPENRLRQPVYDLINASVSYTFDQGLGARLWVKNLTDERYFAFLQADPFKDATSYAAPRTYGITVWQEF